MPGRLLFFIPAITGKISFYTFYLTMKSVFSQLTFKILIFLIVSFSSLSVSAQQKPVSIEGHWIGQGYELYLQQGSFLVQSEGNVAISGIYHLESEYLLLDGQQEKQIYKVEKRGKLLYLLGAETEIILHPGKHQVHRNIFIGSISQISRENQQDESSSQLPENYYN